MATPQTTAPTVDPVIAGLMALPAKVATPAPAAGPAGMPVGAIPAGPVATPAPPQPTAAQLPPQPKGEDPVITGLKALTPREGTATSMTKAAVQSLASPLADIPAAGAIQLTQLQQGHQDARTADLQHYYPDKIKELLQSASEWRDKAAMPDIDPGERDQALTEAKLAEAQAKQLGYGAESTVVQKAAADNAAYNAANPITPAKDRALYHFSDYLQGKLNDTIGKVDPRNADLLSVQLAGGVGTLAGYFLSTLAGGMIGGPEGAVATPLAVAAAQGKAQAFQQAKDLGSTDKQAAAASDWGGLINMAMTLPIFEPLKVLPPAAREWLTGTIVRTGLRYTMNSGAQGGAMYLATVANHLNMNANTSTQTPITQGAGWQALIGAVLGAGTHMVHSMADARAKAKATAAEISPDAKEATGKPATPVTPVTPPDPVAAGHIAADEGVALGANKPVASVADLVHQNFGTKAEAPPSTTPEGNVATTSTEGTTPVAQVPEAAPAGGKPSAVPPVGEVAPPAGEVPPTASPVGEAAPPAGEAAAPAHPLQPQIDAMADAKNKQGPIAVFVPDGVGVPNIPRGAGVKTEQVDGGVIYYNYNDVAGGQIMDAKRVDRINEHMGKAAPGSNARLSGLLGIDLSAKGQADAKAALAPAPSEARQAITALDQARAGGGGSDGGEAPAEATPGLAEALAGMRAVQDAPAPAAEVPASTAKIAPSFQWTQEPVTGFATEQTPAQAPQAEAPVPEAPKKLTGAEKVAEVARKKEARQAAAAQKAADKLAKEKPPEKPLEKAKRVRKTKAQKTAEEEAALLEPRRTEDVTTVTPEGKRVTMLAPSEEVHAATDAFNRRAAAGREADRQAEEKAASETTPEDLADARKQAYDKINKRADAGQYLTSEAEARARAELSMAKAGEDAVNERVGHEVAAAKLMGEMRPKEQEKVEGPADAERLYKRLGDILDRAKDLKIQIQEKATNAVSNAGVWLIDVRMMHEKLANLGELGPKGRAELFVELNEWLHDEHRLANFNDSSFTRARRKAVGTQVKGSKAGGNVNLENLSDAGQPGAVLAAEHAAEGVNYSNDTKGELGARKTASARGPAKLAMPKAPEEMKAEEKAPVKQMTAEEEAAAKAAAAAKYADLLKPKAQREAEAAAAQKAKEEETNRLMQEDRERARAKQAAEEEAAAEQEEVVKKDAGETETPTEKAKRLGRRLRTGSAEDRAREPKFSVNEKHNEETPEDTDPEIRPNKGATQPETPTEALDAAGVPWLVAAEVSDSHWRKTGRDLTPAEVSAYAEHWKGMTDEQHDEVHDAAMNGAAHPLLDLPPPTVARGGEKGDAVHTSTVGEVTKDFGKAEMAAYLKGKIKPGLFGTLQARIIPALADAMRHLVRDVPIHYLDDAKFMEYVRKYWPDRKTTPDAYYDPVRDHIVMRESQRLNDPAGSALTAMHEAAHAAFQQLIAESERAVTNKLSPAARALSEDLESILKAARDHLTKLGEDHEDVYGLTNIHEMVSEMFGSPEFQELMSRVELPKEILQTLRLNPSTHPLIKNVLDAISAVFTQAMRLHDAVRGIPPKTAFEASMDLISRMVVDAPKSREFYFGKENALGRGVPKDTQTRPMAARVRKADNEPRDYTIGLQKRGLPREVAAEMAKVIAEHYPGKAPAEKLDALANAYKAQVAAQKTGVAPPTTRPEVKAKAEEVGAKVAAQQAHTEAQVGEALDKLVGNGVGGGEPPKTGAIPGAPPDPAAAKGPNFMPRKNPGRPWGLKIMGLDQIAQRADDFFGKANNPVRAVEKLVNSRPVLKAKIRAEILKHGLEGLKLRAKYAKTGKFGDLEDLMQDARMANAHPDVALDHENNKHLGKDKPDGPLAGAMGRAQHADLARRYEALPDDLKQHYKDVRDTYTDAQNRMAKALIGETLREFHDQGLVDRFHEGTQTDADIKRVGPDLANHIAKANELTKIKGPYFPLGRFGEFVVRGKHVLTPPGNAEAIKPNIFEFKTKAEALAYAKHMADTKGPHTTLSSVWVDKNTGKTTAEDAEGTVKIHKSDADAEQRWRATVQDQHTEFTDTRDQAIARTKELEQAGLKMEDIARHAELIKKGNDLLSDHMKAIAATVENRQKMSGMSDQEAAQFKQMLNEIAVRFQGNTRVQSHRLPTRMVAGASKDSMRNLYDYADSTAGYLAKIETQGKLNDAMKELDARTSALSKQGLGKGGEGADAIKQEVARRINDPNVYAGKDLKARIVNRLMTTTFLRHLLSPAYTLMNLMQPALLTLPAVAGRHGMTRTAAALAGAYREVHALRSLGSGIKDTAKAFAGKTHGDYLGAIMSHLKDPNEKAMLQGLADDGTINLDNNVEIAHLMTPGGRGIGGALDTGLNYLDGVARALPGAAEAINRSVSALAAYRLELRKNGGDRVAAAQYARDTIRNTHFDYSSSNAAPMMNNPAGRAILQFKKFGLGTYTLLGRNLGLAIRGGEPGERMAAIRTLANIVATHQVAAGTLGLPGMELVKFGLLALSGLGQAAGVNVPSPQDFENMVQDELQKILGNKLGDMVANGISRGLPGGGAFDMRNRIGMDSLMSYGSPKSDDSADVKSWLFDLMSGAGVGTVGDMYTGTSDLISGISNMDEGDFASAAQKLIPIKAVTDIIKATEGVRTGKFNTMDAALAAVGLRSARQDAFSRQTSEAISASNAKNTTTKGLMSDYYKALTPAMTAKAISKINTYNTTAPPKERIRIGPKARQIHDQNMQKYAH